jgi:hypothetical protein
LGNDSKGSKKRLAIVTISLVLLSLLSLASASTAPVAKADAASLVVTPSQGTQGSLVSLAGSGFTPNTPMVITCGSTTLGAFTSSSDGTVGTTFTVRGTPGIYYIYARNGEMVFAETTYTVVGDTASPTSSVSQGSTPTPAPTYGGFPVNPITNTPYYAYLGTPKPAQGGISPLLIGIIVAAIIAIVISVTFFVRRRGGPQPTYEEASEAPVAPAPTYTPRTPTTLTASRYGQTQTYDQYPPRSTMASRPSTASRYRQTSTVSTRVCPRCRQTVRADYSICPHCNKRLR